VIGLLALLSVHPAPVVEVVDVCEVVRSRRSYVGRKFTVRTTLSIGRHDALLNFRADCPSLSFRTLENTQAWNAMTQIGQAMMGMDYYRRFGKKAPMVLTTLENIGVSATGTMVCPTADDRFCVMHITRLDDVEYPATLPREMWPPR
jgi:hypothetical protein